MDSPTKKRKETAEDFTNKKPRLHQEAVHQNQIHNAKKAKEKAQKSTPTTKTPWTKEVRLFLTISSHTIQSDCSSHYGFSHLQEDESLKKLVEVDLQTMHDPKNVKWTRVARWMGVLRSGKQCRERWYQHLRPGLVKGKWTAEEDALVKELHERHGNK
jgi:hypothetical protein